MPQIPTYDTPERYWKLDVPDGGASVLAQAAHRVGIAGQEAENTKAKGNREMVAGLNDITAGFKAQEAKQTQQEASQAPLLIAQDQASRLDDLNKIATTTDPAGIKDRVDQYVGENMGDAKDAFMANFSTKAGKQQAEALWTRHEANIYNHAGAVSEQASRDATHNNLLGAVNQFAATAGAHPSTLDENMGLIDHTIDSQLGSLPQGQRDAFSTTFRQEAKAKALSAGLKTMAFGSPDGSIPPNPGAAKTLLDSGKYDDVIGKNKDALNTMLEGASHQAGIDQASNDVAVHQAAADRSNTATTGYFNQLPQVGGQASPNFGLRVMHDDSVLPEDKAALINAQSKLASGPAPTTNPLTLDHMIGRIASGDKPSNAQLLNQVSAGNLGINEAQFLMGQDPNNPAIHQLQTTLNEGRTTLATNNGSGVSSPAGVQAYQRFQQFAVNAYKSGAPIDAKSMPDVLARFKPTGQDAVNAIPQADRPQRSRPFAQNLNNPPTDAQLPDLVNFESSNRNVTNTDATTSSGRARGYAQITDGTWKDFAPGAVLAKYPTAQDAPREVQLEVAKTIPLKRWAPETLRYMAQRGSLR